MTGSRFSLSLLVASVARLAGRRHRDLVRGMISELEAITDRSERRRFALGAIAAIVRLSVRGLRDRRGQVDLLATAHGALTMNASTPNIDGREILRRLVSPLAITTGVLTAMLVTNFVARQLPHLRAREAPAGTIAELVLHGLPFSIAMTIPMAVFVAVCWVFMRLGADGTIERARQRPGGIRRLSMPVLVAAACLSAVSVVTNTQLIPRSNTRLATVLSGKEFSGQKSDRMMTNGELREAARQVREHPRSNDPTRNSRMAVAYEVEIHKKYALAMACLFLAMVGVALALRFPRGGAWMVAGASVVVFVGYYACLGAGEALADSLALSPLAGMWLANAVLLVVTLLLAWRPVRYTGAPGAESLAIGS